MSSPESQKILALESTRLPTLKSLYEDDEVLEQVSVRALCKESLQNTRPRPVSPHHSDMSLVTAEKATLLHGRHAGRTGLERIGDGAAGDS
jgi:multiple sugar transport system substrate-binding protein